MLFRSQSVIFGQAVDLFYDLSVPARGELLDDVLNIGLWLRLSEDAGKREREKQKEVDEAARQVARAQGVVDSLADESEIEKAISEWEDKRQERIDELISRIERAEDEVAEASSRLARASKLYDQLKRTNADKNAVEKLRNKRTDLEIDNRRMLDQANEAAKRIEFYKKNSVCPTCGTSINQKMAHQYCQQLEMTIHSNRSELQHGAIEINAINQHIAELEIGRASCRERV